MLSTIFRSAAICAGALAFAAQDARAVEIKWTDWTSQSGAGGFTALGTIVSGTETIDVTYTNPNGAIDIGNGTDYWTDASRVRDPATSPYTSTGANGVDNIPDGTDIVRLLRSGSQTLSFSQEIANPVFAFVSLNGNGYGFDQDFEILSGGSMNIDGAGTDACGYWGCGTSFKQVVDLGGGVMQYRLLGTGEPHGVIRFSGAFSTVSWLSLSDENWNGFTLGVEGTSEQVFTPAPVPVPAAGLLLLTGLAGLAALRRKA